MPKKGRHARHVQARATASQNTSGRSSPAPALLDLRVGTPDVAQSVLEQATPEFSIRVERERESSGQPLFRTIGMEDSLYGSIIPKETEDEGGREPGPFWDDQRPSPLALSPLPAPPLVDELVPTDPPAQEIVPDIGHVRAPVIPNTETGMLGSISRTVRGVTSALPRALPTAPRVSRPVSFGSFFTNPQDNNASAPTQPAQAAYPSPSSPPMGAVDGAMQYGSPLLPHGRSPAPRPIPGTGRRRTSAASVASQEGRLHVPDEVSELTLDDQSSGTHYPRVPGRVDEEILFSGWDTLRSGQTTRRILVLGYTAGMQIWDCTELSSVKEIVNVAMDLGKVVEAHVLPDPSNRRKDAFATYRPLLGLIAENSHAVKEMLFYSLKSHRIVHRLDLSAQPTEFTANSKYLIISTSIPIALHICCSTTLAKLFTIPQANLASFTPDNAPKLTSRLSTHLEQSLNYGQAPPKPSSPPPSPHPKPVFALSGRLLAIAAPPPRQDGGPSDDTGVHPRVRTLSATNGVAPGPNQPLFSVVGVSVSQADIGNAAIKVGGGMLSGMRTLGGLAYGAAKAQFAGPRTDVPASKTQTTTAPGLFASKSAPAGYSAPSDSVTSEVTSNLIPVQPPSGHYIRVMDLGSLVNGKAPKTVVEFALQGSSSVANLAFTADGSCLIVAPKDGQVIKVFKLDPIPQALRGSSPTEDSIGNVAPPLHIYDLRRGRSTGSIERIEVDQSGRWIAVGTRNGTVHVFPVNPYGGPPDARSHLEGRVINPDEPMVSLTNVVPLVRMRSPRSVQPEARVFAPLAFAFLDHSVPLPASLRPPPTPYLTPSSPALSLPPSPAQRPVSASPSSGGIPMRAATNYQDLILFEPVDGLLSLRRATLERKRNDSTLSLSVSQHVPVIGGSSMSLPSMGPLSRLGSSPPSAQGSSPQSGSALSQLIRPSGEVFAREDTVATWHLRRAKDWKEIHQVVRQADISMKPTSSRIGRSKWISQAELSTFSRGPRFLPRSTYLAHQFNFFELGHDYHGLIRRFQFEVTGEKIEVRKQVEISAFPTSGDMGESFHGTDAVHGHRRTGSSMGAPSSFDDSLSSAMSAGLSYSAASPRQLPMYPNGASGQRSSYRAGGPIRAVAAGLGEGVSEGIGRLRRGMGQVRSPTTLVPIQGDVPLEFDEDDLVLGDDTTLISAVTPRSVPVPREHAGQLVMESESNTAWSNWDDQDRRTVDEIEEFDEFVVGDLDEDQVRSAPVLPVETTKPKSKKKKKQ